MSNNPLFTDIKNMLDNCETLSDFEGNLPIVKETAVVRSYAMSYACYRGKVRGGKEGLEFVAKTLGISPKSAGNYYRAWDTFLYLIMDGDDLRYPRLSFSFFATLYTYGLRGVRAEKLIERADTEEMTIPHFERLVKEKVSK